MPETDKNRESDLAQNVPARSPTSTKDLLAELQPTRGDKTGTNENQAPESKTEVTKPANGTKPADTNAGPTDANSAHARLTDAPSRQPERTQPTDNRIAVALEAVATKRDTGSWDKALASLTDLSKNDSSESNKTWVDWARTQRTASVVVDDSASATEKQEAVKTLAESAKDGDQHAKAALVALLLTGNKQISDDWGARNKGEVAGKPLLIPGDERTQLSPQLKTQLASVLKEVFGSGFGAVSPTDVSAIALLSAKEAAAGNRELSRTLNAALEQPTAELKTAVGDGLFLAISSSSDRSTSQLLLDQYLKQASPADIRKHIDGFCRIAATGNESAIELLAKIAARPQDEAVVDNKARGTLESLGDDPRLRGQVIKSLLDVNQKYGDGDRLLATLGSVAARDKEPPIAAVREALYKGLQSETSTPEGGRRQASAAAGMIAFADKWTAADAQAFGRNLSNASIDALNRNAEVITKEARQDLLTRAQSKLESKDAQLTPEQAKLSLQVVSTFAANAGKAEINTLSSFSTEGGAHSPQTQQLAAGSLLRIGQAAPEAATRANALNRFAAHSWGPLVPQQDKPAMMTYAMGGNGDRPASLQQVAYEARLQEPATPDLQARQIGERLIVINSMPPTLRKEITGSDQLIDAKVALQQFKDGTLKDGQYKVLLTDVGTTLRDLRTASGEIQNNIRRDLEAINRQKLETTKQLNEHTADGVGFLTRIQFWTDKTEQFDNKQSQLVRQVREQERQIADRTKALEGANARAQLIDLYTDVDNHTKLMQQGKVKEADRKAIEMWGKHGEVLQNLAPTVWRELKGPGVDGSNAFERLKQSGEVYNGKLPQLFEGAPSGMRNGLELLKTPGDPKLQDTNAVRQRALGAIDADPKLGALAQGTRALGSDLQMLQDMVKNGMEGSKFETFTNDARLRARNIAKTMAEIEPKIPEIKAQLEELKRAQREATDDKTKAELKKRIDGYEEALKLFDPNSTTNKQLKNLMDIVKSPKFDPDTFTNWLKREGAVLGIAIACAVAAGVAVGTAGIGSPLLALAVTAAASSGAMLVGQEAAKELFYHVDIGLGDGDRSRLGQYVAGEKVIDQKTGAERDMTFWGDVAYQYGKQWTVDTAMMMATIGAGAVVGKGINSALAKMGESRAVAFMSRNADTLRTMATRSKNVEEVMAKNGHPPWQKSFAREFGDEAFDEVKERSAEDVLQNALGKGNAYLGFMASVLVASGKHTKLGLLRGPESTTITAATTPELNTVVDQLRKDGYKVEGSDNNFSLNLAGRRVELALARTGAQDVELPPASIMPPGSDFKADAKTDVPVSVGLGRNTTATSINESALAQSTPESATKPAKPTAQQQLDAQAQELRKDADTIETAIGSWYPSNRSVDVRSNLEKFSAAFVRGDYATAINIAEQGAIASGAQVERPKIIVSMKTLEATPQNGAQSSSFNVDPEILQLYLADMQSPQYAQANISADASGQSQIHVRFPRLIAEMKTGEQVNMFNPKKDGMGQLLTESGNPLSPTGIAEFEKFRSTEGYRRFASEQALIAVEEGLIHGNQQAQTLDPKENGSLLSPAYTQFLLTQRLSGTDRGEHAKGKIEFKYRDENAYEQELIGLLYDGGMPLALIDHHFGNRHLESNRSKMIEHLQEVEAIRTGNPFLKTPLGGIGDADKLAPNRIALRTLTYDALEAARPGDPTLLNTVLLPSGTDAGGKTLYSFCWGQMSREATDTLTISDSSFRKVVLAVNAENMSQLSPAQQNLAIANLMVVASNRATHNHDGSKPVDHLAARDLMRQVATLPPSILKNIESDNLSYLFGKTLAKEIRLTSEVFADDTYRPIVDEFNRRASEGDLTAFEKAANDLKGPYTGLDGSTAFNLARAHNETLARSISAPGAVDYNALQSAFPGQVLSQALEPRLSAISANDMARGIETIATLAASTSGSTQPGSARKSFESYARVVNDKFERQRQLDPSFEGNRKPLLTNWLQALSNESTVSAAELNALIDNATIDEIRAVAQTEYAPQIVATLVSKFHPDPETITDQQGRERMTKMLMLFSEATRNGDPHDLRSSLATAFNRQGTGKETRDAVYLWLRSASNKDLEILSEPVFSVLTGRNLTAKHARAMTGLDQLAFANKLLQRADALNVQDGPVISRLLQQFPPEHVVDLDTESHARLKKFLDPITKSQEYAGIAPLESIVGDIYKKLTRSALNDTELDDILHALTSEQRRWLLDSEKGANLLSIRGMDELFATTLQSLQQDNKVLWMLNERSQKVGVIIPLSLSNTSTANQLAYAFRKSTNVEIAVARMLTESQEVETERGKNTIPLPKKMSLPAGTIVFESRAMKGNPPDGIEIPAGKKVFIPPGVDMVNFPNGAVFRYSAGKLRGLEPDTQGKKGNSIKRSGKDLSQDEAVKALANVFTLFDGPEFATPEQKAALASIAELNPFLSTSAEALTQFRTKPNLFDMARLEATQMLENRFETEEEMMSIIADRASAIDFITRKVQKEVPGTKLASERIPPAELELERRLLRERLEGRSHESEAKRLTAVQLLLTTEQTRYQNKKPPEGEQSNSKQNSETTDPDNNSADNITTSPYAQLIASWINDQTKVVSPGDWIDQSRDLRQKLEQTYKGRSIYYVVDQDPDGSGNFVAPLFQKSNQHTENNPDGIGKSRFINGIRASEIFRQNPDAVFVVLDDCVNSGQQGQTYARDLSIEIAGMSKDRSSSKKPTVVIAALAGYETGLARIREGKPQLKREEKSDRKAKVLEFDPYDVVVVETLNPIDLDWGLEKGIELNLRNGAGEAALDVGFNMANVERGNARKVETDLVTAVVNPLMVSNTNSAIANDVVRLLGRGKANSKNKAFRSGDLQNEGTAGLNGWIIRGAQPTAEGFEQLKTKHGVDMVIDLNKAPGDKGDKFDTRKIERETVVRLGMDYKQVPVDATKKLSQEQLDQFADMMIAAKAAGKKVFVHCENGSDRTGLFLAYYEMVGEGKSLADVLGKLNTHGYYVDDQHSKGINRSSTLIELVNHAQARLVRDQRHPASFDRPAPSADRMADLQLSAAQRSIRLAQKYKDLGVTATEPLNESAMKSRFAELFENTMYTNNNLLGRREAVIHNGIDTYQAYQAQLKVEAEARAKADGIDQTEAKSQLEREVEKTPDAHPLLAELQAKHRAAKQEQIAINNEIELAENVTIANIQSVMDSFTREHGLPRVKIEKATETSMRGAQANYSLGQAVMRFTREDLLEMGSSDKMAGRMYHETVHLSQDLLIFQAIKQEYDASLPENLRDPQSQRYKIGLMQRYKDMTGANLTEYLYQPAMKVPARTLTPEEITRAKALAASFKDLGPARLESNARNDLAVTVRYANLIVLDNNHYVAETLNDLKNKPTIRQHLFGVDSVAELPSDVQADIAALNSADTDMSKVQARLIQHLQARSQQVRQQVEAEHDAYEERLHEQEAHLIGEQFEIAMRNREGTLVSRATLPHDALPEKSDATSNTDNTGQLPQNALLTLGTPGQPNRVPTWEEWLKNRNANRPEKPRRHRKDS